MTVQSNLGIERERNGFYMPCLRPGKNQFFDEQDCIQIKYDQCDLHLMNFEKKSLLLGSYLEKNFLIDHK